MNFILINIKKTIYPKYVFLSDNFYFHFSSLIFLFFFSLPNKYFSLNIFLKFDFDFDFKALFQAFLFFLLEFVQFFRVLFYFSLRSNEIFDYLIFNLFALIILVSFHLNSLI